MLSFLTTLSLPLKTKKIILLVYDILLIIAGGLTLLVQKREDFTFFSLHEVKNLAMSVYVFLILNSIILLYNIITFYSRKYPYLVDFKLGYETLICAHILLRNNII